VRLSVLVLTLALLAAVPAYGQSALVYESNLEGAYQVFRAAVDGSGETRLTANTCGSFDPDWSPDGTRIVHRRIEVDSGGMCGPSRIWLMDAAGGAATALTPPTAGEDTLPDFAPDGRTVVFSSNRESARSELYLVDASGGPLRRLTNNATTDLFANFAPDGRTIIFVKNEPTEPGRWPAQNVWAIDADGSAERRLTLGGIFLGSPEFSPDGRRLAFTSLGRVFVMAVDGTGLRQLTDGGDAAFDADVTWRPDGRALLLQRFSQPVLTEPETNALHLLDLASGGLSTVIPPRAAQMNEADYYSPSRAEPAALGADRRAPVLRVGGGDDIAATLPAPPAEAARAGRVRTVKSKRANLNIIAIDRSGVRKLSAAFGPAGAKLTYKRLRKATDLARMAKKLAAGTHTLHLKASDVRGNKVHAVLRLKLS
jgi:dipeptidyl aminopeptidase/acylaminoacyl peptidase